MYNNEVLEKQKPSMSLNAYNIHFSNLYKKM